MVFKGKVRQILDCSDYSLLYVTSPRAMVMHTSLLSGKYSFVVKRPTETLDPPAPHCGLYYVVMIKPSLAQVLGTVVHSSVTMSA